MPSNLEHCIRPQVANRYCEGRIVSALEGGYRIQGKIVSAFSRSVAAHVRALSEPNLQVSCPWCSTSFNFSSKAALQGRRRGQQGTLAVARYRGGGV